MTLVSSGAIGIWDIHQEFQRGHDLNAYRGVPWWTDAGESGNFSAGQISMAEFYGKRATAPISNGYVDAGHVGGAGPGWNIPGKYLGVPHANRIVVVAAMTGDTTGSPISSIQIGGVACTFAGRSSGSGSMRACAIGYRHMPGAETHADIRVVNSNNASQCFVGIYAVYSSNHAHIDSGQGSTTASTATATGLISQAGGVAVIASHHRNVNPTTFGGTLGGAWNTNWNADVGGNCNGAVGWKTTDGSSGTANASWAGGVNGSLAVGLFGPM
jgi:hypothetical protein